MKNPVKFGKYYLLERISVGGMAEIFKAKSFGEAGFERLVAVKRILPSIAEDQEFIAMFVDEAKLAVQLTHPNIAQIFELGKVGEAYFIALEYVASKDMRAIFDRARKRNETIPIPMACYMVMKLCEGLDYAHNKKDAAGRSLELVHRDVSPQNILVSYDGDVKLIDFGIAKAASKSSKTQAGILKGKFGYMSPEQVRGLQVDRRSDVFAVGICLYELLTMERLFVGESDFSTLEKVRNVEITPPSAYNRKIPEELEAIVLKALAKHPEDRYRTGMDLHDDLQSFMYTSGNFFARKDLSGYMTKLFGEEIAKEAARDDEFRKFDSRRASDLEVFEGAAVPQPPVVQGRQAPPPPPQSRNAPPPPPVRVARASTSLGVGNGVSTNGVNGSGNHGKPAAPVPASASVSRMPSVPSPSPSVAAAAQAQVMDMDWDEEELATQVYDKPPEMNGYPGLPGLSGMPGVPLVPAAQVQVPTRNAHVNPRSTGSIPMVPQLPSIPGVTGMQGVRSSTSLGMPAPALASAPPPMPMLGAAMPASSLMPVTASIAAPPPGPAPSSMGLMNAPAVGAPAVPAGSNSQGINHAFNQLSTAQNPIPPSSPAAVNGGYSFGNNGAANGAPAVRTNLPTKQEPQWPAGGTTQIAPRKKDNNSVMVLAFLGVIAVAAAVVLGLKLTRGEPMGDLQVTTNVGGVAVLVDEMPQIGNGQSFTVSNLTSSRIHHVVVRKPGFRTFQQDVPVIEGRTTPMQVVLEPEAPPASPALVQAPLPTYPVPPTQPVALPTPGVAANPPALPGTQQLLPPPVPVGVLPPVAPPTPAVAVASAQPRTPRPRQPRTLQNPPTALAPVNLPPPVARPTAQNNPPATGGGELGQLRISTRPVAQCTVDGQSFYTPRIVRGIHPGTHRITCRNADLNTGASWNVTVGPGETVSDLNHPLAEN